MTGHLVHLGFPKAGSTALQHWFERHPELEFAAHGLGGYPNAFEMAARAADPAWTPKAWHVTSSETLSFPHMSHVFHTLDAGVRVLPVPLAESRDRVCGVLRRLFPDATILVVTRGFRSALASSFSQYVRSGGQLDLHGMLAPVEGAEEYFWYDVVVERLRTAFGTDRVWLLPYELLRDDPGAFARELESRMGLTVHAGPVPVANRSLSPAALYWYPRISRGVAAASRRLGPSRQRRLLAAYARLTHEDRLRRIAGLLRAVYPDRRVTEDDIPDPVVEQFRGRAAGLADLPLYGPYAADYLND